MRFVAFIAALLLATPAFAGTVEACFGNTVTTTNSAGATLRWHIDQDGTFAMTTPDGANVNGTWAARGDRFCTTPNGGAEQCFVLVDGKNVGDTWTTTDDTGAQWTLSIVRGR